jgi:hypothetical protein
MSWSTLVKSFGPNAAILSAVLALLIAGGVALRQWTEKPIAIGDAKYQRARLKDLDITTIVAKQ